VGCNIPLFFISNPRYNTPHDVEDPSMARILLVDDNPSVLKFIEDVLHTYAKTKYASTWDLRITPVGSALQALDVVNEHNFELIITDILMARMDGWEFIREIRKKFPQFDTPIVVVSAIQGVDLKYESMRHGASAWFQKPLRTKDFTTEVFKLIQER
jgi:CheY-like chemotaxis protein